MRDFIPEKEELFFDSLNDFFDSEKDAGKQHDIANYSLERMYPLARVAGNPESSLKFIHIAGTKGKGSTSHFISALLTACGRHAGLYTSPHLSTVRERFQLDNSLVSYEELLSQSRQLAEAIRKAELHPSLFELFTLLALRIFARNGMEYAVLETGIGGRLDATNFISRPEVTVITPISFDHMALLGTTIPQIASEKAGILKRGVPVVISRQPYPEADELIVSRAKELGCPVIRPLPLEETLPFLPGNEPTFIRENLSSALAAIRVAGFNPTPERFTRPALRARCECIRKEPPVVLDGAHNADSMQKLVSALKELYPGIAWTVVLGCVQGKDISGIVQALRALPNAHYILTNPHTHKGSALETLEREAKAAGLSVDSIIQDIHSAEALPKDTPLLFTGSFFTALIGEEIFS